MTSKKIFFVLIGLIVIAVGLLFYGAYMSNQVLAGQATQLKRLRLDAELLEAQKAALIIAKKDLEENKEIGTVAKSVVPQDKDQAKTVREIVRLANESGFEIKVINFEASNLGAAAPAPSSEAGESAAPAAPPLSQVKPVSGISGVYSLAISVSPGSNDLVTYPQLLTFLEKLERNRRTAHVAKVTIAPNGGRLSFTLTLNAYVKP